MSRSKMEKADHQASNMAFWNERAAAHAASKDYECAEFVQKPSHISGVVDYDVPLLGSVKGMDCIHLQSHIGTDTLSLVRLGARTAVGVDFSGASVEQAKILAQATHGSGGERLSFIQSDVYKTADVVPTCDFDLVYTGVGSLCWIPDIRAWARVVSRLLKPGGRLFLRDGHPVLYTIDQTRADSMLYVKHDYFEHPHEPTIEHLPGTYVETDQKEFQNQVIARYNHGIGEIIEALLEAGMALTGLREHQSLPWEHFPGQMVKQDNGEWSLRDNPARLPHAYTLQAVKL